MTYSWIVLYPGWYISERDLLARHYPDLKVDERRLSHGELILYGDLVVRPPGGTKRYPIELAYPEGTPYEHPYVTPLRELPEWKEDGRVLREPEPKFFDHRHQMPDGRLCLFQREARLRPGGDVLNCVEILTRAESWFLGLHTGKWPPDTVHSELERHFWPVTDALVEETFYDANLLGRGQMFFIQDYQRVSEKQLGQAPMILTAVTEESGVIRAIDARSALSPVYPWIKDVAWDAFILAATKDLSALRSMVANHGHWWSLPVEPMPFRDGKGLLNVLASAAGGGDAWSMLRDTLGPSLDLDRQHIIGLKYPARDGGVEWLILMMAGGEGQRESGGMVLRGDPEKRRAFEEARVFGVRVHRLQPAVLKLRNRGVVNDIVNTKTVALIGLGALGSEVAELLAKAGVGHFRLCDSDHLSTGNVARHISGIRDFGAPKVLAVKRRLKEINPYLQFAEDDTVFGSAVASLDRLSRLMAPADLTICTTADESVESVINQIAVVDRKAVLYGRSLRTASIGRVFLVRPGQDACKSCLAHYAKIGREGEAVPADWIDVRDDGDGILLHECGRPVIAGSAVDLSFIAAIIARVALDYLQGEAIAANHWLWTRSAAAGIDPRLAKAMATFTGHLPPLAGCPACQEPDVVGLVMPDEVRQSLRAMTEASPEAETGGVLIGFVDERGRAVALRATGPGPNAEQTARRFRRDVQFVQSELDRAASELGDQGQYIGEWHSHLVAHPQPSPTDIDSLVGISRALNYPTRCPIMVIVGLDPASKKAADVRSWAFPVSGRVFSIPSEILEQA